MNESNHVMLRILSEDAGLDTPVSARYERTTRKGMKNRAWINGLGGDTVFSAVSVLVMMTLMFLG